MKKIKLIAVFIFVWVAVSAQNSVNPTDSIYQAEKVEKMPEFPGGEMEMMKFIQKNIVYPQEEKEAGVMGSVYVSFVIDTAGNIREVEVLKGVPEGPGLEAEAVRMIKQMPRWNPGMQSGRTVNCRFTLPIKYSITNGRKKKKKKE